MKNEKQRAFKINSEELVDLRGETIFILDTQILIDADSIIT